MVPMSFSAFDTHMMDVALVLARRALGTTAPNPAVGAVIADETTGEVIARGATRPGGRPHAETEALARAGTRARGATLYVTLEPCAHYGQTPPCADAVVRAEVRRVVIGIEDPDPRTRGDGIRRLEAAGIAVDVGCRAEAAHWTALGHILRITRRRPFVELKMALADDGSVPRGADGTARIVTGAEARAAAHMLRAEADAILIGGGTARDDDPALTCRLPGLAARSPIRVVLSRGLDLSPDLTVIRTAREVATWIFTGEDADAAHVRRLEAAGVRVFRLAGQSFLPHPAEGESSSLRSDGESSTRRSEGESSTLRSKGESSTRRSEGLGVGRAPTADVPDLPPPSLPHKGGGTARRGLCIRSVLARLADEGITRLLVEGGPQVWHAFASEKLADEVVLLQAGGKMSAPGAAAELAARLTPGLDLGCTETRQLGADLMTTFRVLRPAEGS